MQWLFVTAAVLAGAHVLLAYAWPTLTQPGVPPDQAAAHRLRPQLNVALYIAHLFVIGSVLVGGRHRGARSVLSCLAGYAAVVWLVWPLVVVLQENTLLLVLAAVLYGGMIHHPRLLGYLYLFLLCQRFLPAYLYPSFLLSSLLYTTLAPFLQAWRGRRERFVPLCHVAGLMLLTCLLLPIIFFCMQSSPQDVQQRFREVEVLAALGTSLKTSALATVVVLFLGVPMAYALVRRSFPGKGLIDTLIDLPIVVPPPVAGIALLAFLGPKAPMGQLLKARLDIELFDTAWGIVAAQVFVASPYLIRASMVAFAAVDERYENVARTLGATNFSAFVRVTLPLSLRGILIGVILTWFRAMAEFAAVRVMANNPKTIPILTWDRFNFQGQEESQSVGVLILLLCMGVIVGMWIIRAMPNLLGRSIGASDAAR